MRRAVLLLMESVLDGDVEQEELMGDFLRGEQVSKKELTPFRVREELESRTAFRFLRSQWGSVWALHRRPPDVRLHRVAAACLWSARQPDEPSRPRCVCVR